LNRNRGTKDALADEAAAEWRRRYLSADLPAPRPGALPDIPAARCFAQPARRPVSLLERAELIEVVTEATDCAPEEWDRHELVAWIKSLRERRDTLDALQRESDRLAALVASERAQRAAVESTLREVAGSTSYRLGGRIVRPLAALRSLAGQARRVISQPALWRGHLATLRRLRAESGARGMLRRLAKQGPAGGAATADPDYEAWFARYARPDAEASAAMRDRIAAMAAPPTISVLMPVYNTPPSLLREAVASVRAQVYPHWQLAIADDASTRAETRETLRALAAEDERIDVVWCDTNRHISAASNAALEAVTGSHLALLDHDDCLTEDALYHVAEAAIAHPDAVLIYSDEDKLDEHGRLYEPYFKPDWNPDLLRSQNYINHLSVYRSDAVRGVGGFREGFEGSQDYDLLLRVTDAAAAGAVHHIPRVLYHWRAVAGSEAQQAGIKDYTRDAAHRALTEHLARRGEAGVVLPSRECPGMWRVRYALPEPPPRVSIVIPTRNGLHLVTRCLETLLNRTDYPDYEVLLVDNGSDDEAVLGYLHSFATRGPERVRVIRDARPFNYPALNNRAVAAATGGVLVLLNNDVEVTQADWLRELVSHAVRPGVGCVGGRLWYPDDTLQHAGCVVGIGGVAGHVFKDLPRGRLAQFGRSALIQNYSAVTAACLAVRRSLYREVGGLDEEALAVAFNDIDFCLKVRELGYRNLWTPHAELYHHESATRGYEDTPEKQQRFAGEVRVMTERWGEALHDDPAYNPNLTLEHTDCSLAWPPRERRSEM